ncbi:MAG: magnesium transporter [Deltaproteobacteria bacterium]|nr:magnesium transporter [Deltaproteobacteria bacterium]
MEFKNIPIHDIAIEAKELLQAGNLEAVKNSLAPLHSTDIALLFEAVGEGAVIARLFRLLSPEVASETLLELEGRVKEELLEVLSHKELTDIVGEMATDDMTDIVSELSEDEGRKVLDGIEWKEAIVVQKLLKYPEDTAGGKMQAELVRVELGVSVNDAIDEVRKKSEEVQNIACVFVTDSDGRLEGTVALDKLILAKPKTLIEEIVNKDTVRVMTDLDQEEVARIFQRYDLLSLAVVDSEERLVGRITVDDVVDVIEEEIFEDFYRMASLNTGERALDNPRRSFGMRSPWLLLNLGTALIAAGVVKLFEGTIESFVILAVLMPIVAGIGGNAATQTITVIIRGLALGELNLRNARKVIMKEAIVGLANGLLIGIVAALAAFILGANFMIGLLLFLAMTASLLIAGLAGSTIPLILKSLKADPALSSSVFVTACTDVAGFFTFLGLAALFIKLGLL